MVQACVGYRPLCQTLYLFLRGWELSPLLFCCSGETLKKKRNSNHQYARHQISILHKITYIHVHYTRYIV